MKSQVKQGGGKMTKKNKDIKSSKGEQTKATVQVKPKSEIKYDGSEVDVQIKSNLTIAKKPKLTNVYTADFKAIDDTIEDIKKASRKVSTNDYATNNVYLFVQNCLKRILEAEKQLATKLNVDTGGNAVGKKLWEMHQAHEQTAVDNYKEGVCFICFHKDVVSATIIDICGDCGGKRGREALLVPVGEKYYGMCMVCGIYRFHIENINARFCRNCYKRIIHKMHGAGEDPFWKSMRRKHGKDWAWQMNDSTKSIRR